MSYMRENLLDNVYYFLALLFFFVILMVSNTKWIAKKVKAGKIDINIDESSIIFLNHYWTVYTYMGIWFILNFIQVEKKDESTILE
jgi:hypothetical protein